MKSNVQRLAGTVGCLPNNPVPFFLLSEPISFFYLTMCPAPANDVIGLHRSWLQNFSSVVIGPGWACDPLQSTKTKAAEKFWEKKVPPWLKAGTWWKRPFVTSHFYLLEVVVWRRDVCRHASRLGTLATTGRGQQGDSKSPSFADVMRIAFLQNCLPLDVLFYEINTIIGTTLGQLFPS